MTLMWDSEPTVGGLRNGTSILRRGGGQGVLTYVSRLRAPCLALLVFRYPFAARESATTGFAHERTGDDG